VSWWKAKRTSVFTLTRETTKYRYSYDKRDDFNFPIVNFPFICNNIPAAPAYGVYISQLIRYSRDYGSYHDFLDRGMLLTRELLNLLVKLKSSLRKFYGRDHDLVDRYGIYVSQMTTDMFHLSQSLPGSFLIGFPNPFKKQELLPILEHMSSPPVFWWVHVLVFLVFVFSGMCLYVLRSVLWYPQRFPHKNDVRFVLYIQLFVGGLMAYLRFMFCLSIVVSNIYCIVFLLCLSLSCVPNVVGFFRLSFRMVYLSWWFPDILIFDTLLKICAEYRLK